MLGSFRELVEKLLLIKPLDQLQEPSRGQPQEAAPKAAVAQPLVPKTPAAGGAAPGQSVTDNPAPTKKAAPARKTTPARKVVAKPAAPAKKAAAKKTTAKKAPAKKAPVKKRPDAG